MPGHVAVAAQFGELVAKQPVTLLGRVEGVQGLAGVLGGCEAVQHAGGIRHVRFRGEKRPQARRVDPAPARLPSIGHDGFGELNLRGRQGCGVSVARNRDGHFRQVEPILGRMVDAAQDGSGLAVEPAILDPERSVVARRIDGGHCLPFLEPRLGLCRGLSGSMRGLWTHEGHERRLQGCGIERGSGLLGCRRNRLRRCSGRATCPRRVGMR